MRTNTGKFRRALTWLTLVGFLSALVMPFVLVTPVSAESGSSLICWGKILVEYSWPNEVVVGEEFDVTVTVTNQKWYSLVLTYLALNSGGNEASCQGYPYYYGLAAGFATADPISATVDGTPAGQIIRDRPFICSSDWSPYNDPNANPVELFPKGQAGDSYTFTWHLTATQAGTYDWTDGGGSDRSMLFVEIWTGMMTMGSSDFSETIITVTEPPPEVDIDIKPGSDPNSINLKSKGVVLVAVLTTDDFDASTVDPDTVLFADAAPLRWTQEDVDGDGDMDLLFHFRTQELNLTEDSTEATLTGETFDEAQIQGMDTVNIVPLGK